MWQHLGRVGAMLALAALLAAGAAAQTVVVRGWITDASSGEPLPGANVVLRAGAAAPLGAVSDKNGFYQLSEVPAGRYAVRVSFIGYEAFADTLRFGDRPLVRLNVALAPAEEVLG
ncbi:MAG: carboxypeptidase-like regulatory domain-containing protein, partial [Rhodothermales bacterium]|nr:carboxypeptidase-like regulatory domain-containing protein [Rhodothermales bacterium]